MALLHRRKAFSSVSRYRFFGRSSFSSSTTSTALSERANLSICSSSSFCTPMKSMPKSSPAVAMWSSLWRHPRSYTTVAASLEVQQSNACCYNHRWAFDWRCRCSNTGVPRVMAQNCTTEAYPPPSPPPDFQGVDQEADADGAPLNMDDPEDVAGIAGAEDFDRPPYEDANYPEDEEEYEDEEPPPDPEEKLLYSPSDED